MIKSMYIAIFFATCMSYTALFAQRSSAAVLKNADLDHHTITLINGATRQTKMVQSGATIKEFCLKGCIVRIDNDPNRDFLLEGNERVTIENGLLYYDGEISPEVHTDNGKKAPQQ